MANQRWRFDDYVIGLITGRTEEQIIETEFGPKLIQSFVPSKRNPNPPLSQVRDERAGRFSEDQIMVYEGLRHRRMFIRYGSFAKSPKEKRELKKAKQKHKSTLIKAGFNPKQRLNISEPQVLR
jgi:hypothetical protein